MSLSGPEMVMGVPSITVSVPHMGANASFMGVNAALAAGHGYTVNQDMLENVEGYFATYGGGPKGAAEILTRDTKEWDITARVVAAWHRME